MRMGRVRMLMIVRVPRLCRVTSTDSFHVVMVAELLLTDPRFEANNLFAI